MVDMRQDVVEAPGLAEMALDQRQRPAPEGRVAADLLFDEQALAFMHRHAAGLAERPVRPLLRQVLLVKRMAGLVQDAHQRRQEVGRPVAGGDAHVGRHAAAERVVRDRQAAVGEVEADGRHHREPELALPVDRVGARERLQRALGEPLFLHGERLGHEILEEALQLGEHRRDVGGAVARDRTAPSAHHRAAGRARRRAAPPPRAPAPRRLRAPAGSPPSRSSAADRATAARSACVARVCRSTNSVGRQVMLVYCRRNSRNAAACCSSLSASCLGRGEPVADLRRGCLAMVHAGKRRHRLGPLLAAADRHMGGLVGAEDGQRMLQPLQPAAMIVELGKRHGHSVPAGLLPLSARSA